MQEYVSFANSNLRGLPIGLRGTPILIDMLLTTWVGCCSTLGRGVTDASLIAGLGLEVEEHTMSFATLLLKKKSRHINGMLLDQGPSENVTVLRLLGFRSSCVLSTLTFGLCCFCCCLVRPSWTGCWRPAVPVSGGCWDRELLVLVSALGFVLDLRGTVVIFCPFPR